MMPMSSGRKPSPTLLSPTSCKVRIRWALMKIWSVSEGTRRMRQAVP